MNTLDDSANADQCMLYEDSANLDRISDISKPLKDGRRGHKNHHVLVRQREAKLKQAPQSKANVCRRQQRKCNHKKPPLLIAQDTQHKLGVAFSYLERKNHYLTSSSMLIWFR